MAPRGRGRPKKDAASPAVEAPQRRGRTPKVVAPGVAPVVVEPQPKKRGRPAKAPVEEVPPEVEEATEEPHKRPGRGRQRFSPPNGADARASKRLSKRFPPRRSAKVARPKMLLT
jgi:hypothetical protein